MNSARPHVSPVRSGGVVLRLALLGVLALGVPLAASRAQQQQPPPPAPAAPAQPAAPAGPGVEIPLRLHFIILDQYAYTQHPYFQITEDPGYEDGDAATGSSLQLGQRNTDDEDPFFLRAVHNLPSFGLEGVRPLDIPFPQGVGFGFDFLAFSQQDAEAAGEGSAVTAIRTDTYIYTASLKFYAFDPTEPGINYFFGFSVGLLEGTMLVPIAGQPDQVTAYGQSPIGAQRVGLETKGENWGFRYELILLNADKVRLDEPYPPYAGGAVVPTETTIDFSGSIVRLSLFYEFD